MFTFRIEIYIDGLLISGSFDQPSYRRVSDALNSRLHRYVTLRDASIAPSNRPQQIQRVPTIMVDWGSAMLVGTLEEPPPPPDIAQSQSYAVRDQQPMMFFTGTFALRANFFKRPDFDLAMTLDQMTDDFIPLSEVQIFPLQGGQPTSRDFVCLNRHAIRAMYAVTAPSPVAPPAAPTTDAVVEGAPVDGAAPLAGAAPNGATAAEQPAV